MKRLGVLLIWCLTMARVLAACGASSTNNPGLTPADDAPGVFDTATPTDAGTRSPDDTGLPPEMNVPLSFQTPAAGGRYVYIADPSGDIVAVIDSSTLSIETVTAGAEPTYLATVAGQDTAIVINVRSSTASVLRTTPAGTATHTLALSPGANSLAVAPDGHHVIAWQNDTLPGMGISTGSFQDLTVLNLDATAGDNAVPLTVGFMPRDVQFSADGTSAFIVTDDGVSVLHFANITGPSIVPNVPLGGPSPTVSVVSDGGAMPMNDGGVTVVSDAGTSMDAAVTNFSDAGVVTSVTPAGVSITPDGRYALAWFQGFTTVQMVDLTTRAINTLDVGGVVTDMALSADGSRVVAVVRDLSLARVIPVPQGFVDPSGVHTIAVPGQIIGSVAISPVGDTAILYTSAVAVPVVTVADLTGVQPPAVIQVHKGIRAVAFAPDGLSALVVHTHADGDPNQAGISVADQIDRSFGYSLIEPAMLFARLQLTPADVGPFALMPGGDEGFVLLRDDMAGVAEVQRVSMRSFEVQSIPLGSPPVSVGAVPATMRAFVGEDHPEGRITFIDWSTGALQTVTGFELNARVVQ